MIDQDVMQKALLTSNVLANEASLNAGDIALDEGIKKANPEAKDVANTHKAIMMMAQAEQQGKEPIMTKFKNGVGDYAKSANEQRAIQEIFKKLA